MHVCIQYPLCLWVPLFLYVQIIWLQALVVCVYMWPLCATRVTGALGGGVKFIVNCTTHVVGFNKCVSMT